MICMDKYPKSRQRSLPLQIFDSFYVVRKDVEARIDDCFNTGQVAAEIRRQALHQHRRLPAAKYHTDVKINVNLL